MTHSRMLSAIVIQAFGPTTMIKTDQRPRNLPQDFEYSRVARGSALAAAAHQCGGSFSPSARRAGRALGDVANCRITGPLTKYCGSRSEEKPAFLAAFTCCNMFGRCWPSSCTASHSSVTNKPTFMAASLVPVTLGASGRSFGWFGAMSTVDSAARLSQDIAQETQGRGTRCPTHRLLAGTPKYRTTR
jgi:hypothetical protein